jgi:hypothetical protein
VPGTVAHIRMPPSYRPAGDRWQGPDGSFLTVTSVPHLVPDPRDPEVGIATGPSCTMPLGERVLGFSYWSEIPQEGGVWHGTSVSWEEPPGTDVRISAIALDSRHRWEQLRILHSLR